MDFYKKIFCCLLFTPIFAQAMLQSAKSFKFAEVIYENQLSFGWGKLNLESPSELSKITKNIQASELANRQMLELDFQQNWLNIFHILKWGFQASISIPLYKSQTKTFVMPLQLSSILSLQLTHQPRILPFISAGCAVWNINWNAFSSYLAFWSLGTKISFALIKPALNYTLLDDYGIDDIGILIQTSSFYLTEKAKPEENIILASWQIGTYFHF